MRRVYITVKGPHIIGVPYNVCALRHLWTLRRIMCVHIACITYTMHQFNLRRRLIGNYAANLKGFPVISSSNLICRELRYSATLYRKPRNSSLSRSVTTHITLTTEQWIDVQGHTKSSTYVAISSPWDFLLVINCHISSISHCFWDTASQSLKPPNPSLSPRSRGPLQILPSNSAC